MKAIHIYNYGGPDVLVYEDAPRPTPGARRGAGQMIQPVGRENPAPTIGIFPCRGAVAASGVVPLSLRDGYDQVRETSVRLYSGYPETALAHDSPATHR